MFNHSECVLYSIIRDNMSCPPRPPQISFCTSVGSNRKTRSCREEKKDSKFKFECANINLSEPTLPKVFSKFHPSSHSSFSLLLSIIIFVCVCLNQEGVDRLTFLLYSSLLLMNNSTYRLPKLRRCNVMALLASSILSNAT